jgi:hypothetical protein
VRYWNHTVLLWMNVPPFEVEVMILLAAVHHHHHRYGFIPIQCHHEWVKKWCVGGFEAWIHPYRNDKTKSLNKSDVRRES